MNMELCYLLGSYIRWNKEPLTNREGSNLEEQLCHACTTVSYPLCIPMIASFYAFYFTE